MNNKNLIKILVLFVMLVGVTFFIFSIIYMDYFRLKIEGNVKDYGVIMIFLVVFILELFPQYLSPHLVMINGWVIGLPLLKLTLFIVLAHILASTLGFYLGKRYGLRLIKKIYGQNEIFKISHKMDRYGKWVVLLSAFLPIPYTPLIFGSLNLSWNKFTFFGIIPRGVSFILLGLGFWFLTL
ncbi:VTT domain-containing protein [Patescibacteria group bacterium]|nr:VTT domain-containing protein [Patescibacteria group bacterium]